MVGLGLVKVNGRSMEPTLHSGDRMIVLRGAPPKLGRLAIVRLPPDDSGSPRPLAIKRVTMRDPDDPSRYWVEADNQGAEGVVDSWTLGQSFPREHFRARVLFRIPQSLSLADGVRLPHLLGAAYLLRTAARLRGRRAGGSGQG